MLSLKSMGMGQWAFLAGLLLVFLVGFQVLALDAAIGTGLIVVVGLIVAAMNISGSESQRVLLAGILLVLVGVGFLSGAIGGLFPAFESVMSAFGTFLLSIGVWFAVITMFFSSSKK